jgi:hypothetical protein
LTCCSPTKFPRRNSSRPRLNVSNLDGRLNAGARPAANLELVCDIEPAGTASLQRLWISSRRETFPMSIRVFSGGVGVYRRKEVLRYLMRWPEVPVHKP